MKLLKLGRLINKGSAMPNYKSIQTLRNIKLLVQFPKVIVQTKKYEFPKLTFIISKVNSIKYHPLRKF